MRKLDGQEPEKIHPWYRGFNGTIAQAPDAKQGERAYFVTGVYKIIDDQTLEITELPLGLWTGDYKEFLEGLIKPEKKEEVPFITDYKEYHTDVSVHFVITMPAENLKAALDSGIEKKFKLANRISTTNMHAFDAEGKITKYESPEAVINAFFPVRLDGCGPLAPPVPSIPRLSPPARRAAGGGCGSVFSEQRWAAASLG